MLLYGLVFQSEKRLNSEENKCHPTLFCVCSLNAFDQICDLFTCLDQGPNSAVSRSKMLHILDDNLLHKFQLVQHFVPCWSIQGTPPYDEIAENCYTIFSNEIVSWSRPQNPVHTASGIYPSSVIYSSWCFWCQVNKCHFVIVHRKHIGFLLKGIL